MKKPTIHINLESDPMYALIREIEQCAFDDLVAEKPVRKANEGLKAYENRVAEWKALKESAMEFLTESPLFQETGWSVSYDFKRYAKANGIDIAKFAELMI